MSPTGACECVQRRKKEDRVHKKTKRQKQTHRAVQTRRKGKDRVQVQIILVRVIGGD